MVLFHKWLHFCTVLYILLYILHEAHILCIAVDLIMLDKDNVNKKINEQYKIYSYLSLWL